MAIPESSRVYVDSCVWTDIVFKKKDPEGKLVHRRVSTRKFLSELATGRCTGVVSTLVIHEVVTSCRRLLADRMRSPPTIEDTKKLERLTTRVLNKFGIEVRDADSLARLEPITTPLFSRAHEISIASGIHRGEAGNWHHVSGMDAVHASLAEKADAQFLATHDKAMKHLSCGVKPAYLEDEYP